MRVAAFFDVDETLISVKSIFRFLAFHLNALGRPRQDYERMRGRLRDMASSGMSRTDSLAVYFRSFAGMDAALVAEHGRRWFAEEMARGGLFHHAVLDRFDRHRSAGELTVLVSGSFPACLDPIAEHVGADLVLCSMPEIERDCYTGEIAIPMVGTAKADAVRTESAVHDVRLVDSYAYGDHSSDIPVLELVGNPVVVGDDPDLAAHADRHGWPRLPTSSVRVP